MNRKSNAANLRKSVKPRESHAPGSAGAPSSARRGFGNRTILETTRNSVGSSRMSQYGHQANKKDTRIFNDEFIQATFRRLRDFLTQRNLLSEMPTSPKLTSRQFESLFLILMRSIFSTYNPPPGNNWMELEVPIIMESLSYPQKVMKYTLQTVSSKVGPIMGIIDFLIDLATGMDCDHQEAIRLLSRDESPNQFELQIELLAQSTFAKGVTVDSPHIQQLIKDFCSRSKGIADEDGIRDEHQRVLSRKVESEAVLQALELQQAELESVQEECESHRKFIVRMEQRKQSKEQELEQIREQRRIARERISTLKQQIAGTRSIVDAQPISQEDIRRIRAESKDLEEQNNILQQKTNEAYNQIELLRRSTRVHRGNIQNLCGDITSSLAAANIPESKDRVIGIVGNVQESEYFLEKLKAEQDATMRKIADFQSQAELRLFELSQKMSQWKTAVEFAAQDKEAVDKKFRYFGERLKKKDAELLFKRQALKDTDNLITFAEKEVEDLKIQAQAVQDQLEVAEKKFEEQKFLAEKAQAFTKFYEERLEKTRKIDRLRMEQLVSFYRDQKKKIPTEQVARAIIDALDRLKDETNAPS